MFFVNHNKIDVKLGASICQYKLFGMPSFGTLAVGCPPLSMFKLLGCAFGTVHACNQVL